MQTKTLGDQTMVRYLLGELSEEERLAFEEQYANDEEYFDQLLAIEDDLIQEYVHDELTADERRRFEEYFLISPQRREKVKRAKALLQVIQKQPRVVAGASRFAEAIRVWQRLKSGLKFLLNPNPAVSFAIFIVGAIIGGRWIYLTTENLQTQLGQFDQERAALLEANQELRQQIAQQSSKLDEALQNESSLRAQLEKKLAQLRPRAASVAFALSTYDSERGPEGGAEALNLAIPRGADSVRLQLELKPEDDSKSYRAILEMTNQDEIIWSQEILPTSSPRGSKIVVLSLPAIIFSDGEYALKLHGIDAKGELEETSSLYFFRTKRR